MNGVSLRTAGLAGVAIWLVCLALSPQVQAQDFDAITHTVTGNTEVFRIDRPNVKVARREYTEIRFQAGDQIMLQAGGCAQTGGSGNTWKLYVNPTGSNSDHLYHGQIEIAGATFPSGKLLRIADVMGRPIAVPQNITSAPDLVLGYEDDNYDDNGYWGHDDGTEDQCKNVGNAFVILTVQHNTPTPMADAAPYDVTPSMLDDNNLPLNPKWGWQVTHPGQLPSPDLCGGSPWTHACTNQNTSLDTNSTMCPCPGPACPGRLAGHANWGIVTYEGPIHWETHSGIKSTGPPTFTDIATDDDYNINLVPPAQSGFVQGDERIHMEFDSDETIDHFGTPFWTTLHAAVDAEDSRALALPGTSPEDLLNNKCAIAIGLMGLDCAHGCGTELHPLLGLAVHLRDDPQDDQWMIFVRNWGNEGYCSSGTETADMVTFTFRIPRPGSTAVKSLGSSQFFTRKGLAAGPFVDHVADGALVTFTMPIPSSQERIHGDLHLQWTGGSNVSTCTITAMARIGAPAPAVPSPELEPEAKIRNLIAKLSPAQRKVFDASLKSKPVAADHAATSRQAVAPKVTARRRRVDPSVHPAQVFAGAPKAHNVPDAERAQEQQDLLQALKKAYGGQIPGFPPDKPAVNRTIKK